MQVKTMDAVSGVTKKVNPSAGQNYTKQGGAGSMSGNVGYSTSALNSLNKSIAKTSPSSGGSGSGSGGNASALYGALLNAYANNNVDDSYYQQMKAAAQNAYNNGMNALNSAYDAQMNSLRGNLDSTKSQLQNSYNNSRNDIQQDAENSLRQAYINKMLSQRNLGQQMSAQGLSGGATETTLASMQNNYGNARNNINTTANKNLTNLEQNYNDNLAQALQAYNSAVASSNLAKAQQQMQLESALANNQISALGDYQNYVRQSNADYLDLLKAAIQKGANFSFDPTTVSNMYKALGMTQATPQTSGTNYAQLQALQNNAGAQASGNTLANANTNSNANLLAALLSQLG